ncbi:hypothetical protein AAD018_007435 [Aestuariibius insulae]|uniref:hypothetical protein n=1 Tax=Aestuariibius insulae TaxID=2058287 RepID=UPI00345E861C
MRVIVVFSTVLLAACTGNLSTDPLAEEPEDIQLDTAGEQAMDDELPEPRVTGNPLILE